MPAHRPIAEQQGQLSCFDHRVGQNPTRTARPLEQDLQMQLVLAEVRRRGLAGATRYELAEALGMLDNTVGPRLSDLRRDGYLRKTEAARQGALVWVAR